MTNPASILKNVYLLQFIGYAEMYIPLLWPSAKTYYELHGERKNQYQWIVPTVEYLSDVDKIKLEIAKNPPSVFGVSLYVWNYDISLTICKWVKETWPDCIVITGGPQQYFKHYPNWFVDYPFIDASLPSEVYGELTMCDLLDNINADQTVNWNQLEQVVYPSKNRTTMFHSPKSTYKLEFDWNYSALDSQQEHIAEYIEGYRKTFPGRNLHGKIEGTRGCPYECTYCDWGGGTGSKVNLKSMECVKKDIDTLVKHDLSTIMICNANFGIHGPRDVDTIKYIASIKDKMKAPRFPDVILAGYAKTNKHYEYIKEIACLLAANDLTRVFKASIQSFQKQVLDNIKRTDLDYTKLLAIAGHVQKEYRVSAQIELIMGMPGMTLDNWYNEFNVPYDVDMRVMAYEWYLMPESEAYDASYRKQFKIGTAKKQFNNSHDIVVSPAEIVVETSTYTRSEFKEMMSVVSVNSLFLQSGIYRDIIKHSLKINNLTYGQFLKMFYKSCYPKLKEACPSSIGHYEQHLEQFVADEINNVVIETKWNGETDVSVLIWDYFIVEYYKNFEILDPIVKQWFVDHLSISMSALEKESIKIHSEKRNKKSKRTGILKINYDRFDGIKELLTDLERTLTFTYGQMLIGRPSLF